MDVNLMLNNAFSASREELKDVLTATTTARNRTPWDAGGYSLPIIQQRKPVTVDSSIHFSDSPCDRSDEPLSRHSLSDSRSSLSSFASATTSGTHSRFSSASTLGGFHTFPGFTVEAFSVPEDSSHRDKLYFRSPLPTSPITTTAHTRAGSLHTSFMNTLIIIADDQQQEYQEEESHQDFQGQMLKTGSAPKDSDRQKDDSSIWLRRSASPSDAILIRRSGPSVSRSLPDVHELALRTSLHVERSDNPQMLEDTSFEFFPPRFSPSTKTHKRATSAPDIQAISNRKYQKDAKEAISSGSNAVSTPSLSYDMKQELPSPIIQHTRRSTPPKDDHFLTDQQPKCMFSQDCDTGSPPRKAISHIFGRNKMCTRLIPQQVWVHLCRKHYQRSRYRNLTLFAHNTQCELVQQQVQNLEDWSEVNKLRGEGGIVKNWELAVRKREQKRLDDLASAKNSGSSTEKRTEDPALNLSISTPSTAPPEWLRELCGTGYKTSDIREILSRLQQEMMAGIISMFPDIEILPNIVVDREGPKSPKGYAKRKAVHGAHQRSKSLGTTLRCDLHSPEQPMSQLRLPSSLYNKSSLYDGNLSPSRKRKTYEDRDETNRSRSAQPSQNLSGASPSPIFIVPIHQIEHGQSPDTEYYAREEEFGSHTSIKYHQHLPRSSHGPPLPAPTPRRYVAPMASHLEEHAYSAPRGFHKRSQSDLGAFRLTPPTEQYPEISRYSSPPVAHLSVPERPTGHTRQQSSPALTVQPNIYRSGDAGHGSRAYITRQNSLPLPKLNAPESPEKK